VDRRPRLGARGRGGSGAASRRRRSEATLTRRFARWGGR
jgi:hypothetical protein